MSGSANSIADIMRTTSIQADDPMLIPVKLPPSEFVDRYLVCALRVRKLTIGNPSVAEHAKAWLVAHEFSFEQLRANFAGINAAVCELTDIHEELWLLEDRVRATAPPERPYFQDLAREIFRLNDLRHALKLQIDKSCGAAATGLRFYTSQNHE